MRASFLHWACALLVLDLEGQFTSAKIAHERPARPEYRPRILKRQLWNSTDPLDGLFGGGESPSPASSQQQNAVPSSPQNIPSSTSAQETTAGSSPPARTSSSVASPGGGFLAGLFSPSPSTQGNADLSSSTAIPPSNGLLSSITGSGGIVPDSVAPPTAAPAPQTSTSTQPPASAPSSNPIVVGLNTILGGSTSSDSGASNDSNDSASSQTDSGLLDSAPLLGTTPSPSRPQQNSTAAPSSSGGLLEPILGGLVPSPRPAQSTTTDDSESAQTGAPSRAPAPSTGLLGPILGTGSPSPSSQGSPSPQPGILGPLLGQGTAPSPSQSSSTPSPGLLRPILGTGSPSPSTKGSPSPQPGILGPLLGQGTAPSPSQSSSTPSPGLLRPILGTGSPSPSTKGSPSPQPGILGPLLGQGTAPSPSQSSSTPSPGLLRPILGTGSPSPSTKGSPSPSSGILDPLLGQGTAPSSSQSSPAPVPGILDPLLGSGTAPSPAQGSAPSSAPGLLGPLLGGGQPTNSTTKDGGLFGGLLPPATQTPDLVTVSGTGGKFVLPKPTDATGTGLVPQTTDQPEPIPGFLSSLLRPSPTNSNADTGTPSTPGPNATSSSSNAPSNSSSQVSSGLTPSQDPTLSSSSSSELPPTGTGGLTIPSSFTLSTTAGTDGRTSAFPVPATTTPSNATLLSNTTTPVPSPAGTVEVPEPGSPTAEKTTPPSNMTPTAPVRGPQSILPIGSNTDTVLAIPTQIVSAPQGSNQISAGAAPTETKPTPGLPTYMPRLIQAPGGMPKGETGLALIQVGFNYSLNFLFVVDTDNATSQIFAYLPMGISRGLNIREQDVVMNALMPYDTSATMGYITTLAQAYIPKDMVTVLEQALHAPTSPLYNNPDLPVRQLMSMVNPAIPLLPGSSLDDGSADESGTIDTQAAQRASTAGAPIGGSPPTSAPVSGTTVGIGVGAVAGAAVYAAAMIFVARRYRQRRQVRHSRNLSAPSAERGEPRMSEVYGGRMSSIITSANGGRLSGFPAFGRYSGSGRSSANSGRGSHGSRNSGHSGNSRSVRDQGISNPIMSENSLGWN